MACFRNHALNRHRSAQWREAQLVDEMGMAEASRRGESHLWKVAPIARAKAYLSARHAALLGAEIGTPFSRASARCSRGICSRLSSSLRWRRCMARRACRVARSAAAAEVSMQLVIINVETAIKTAESDVINETTQVMPGEICGDCNRRPS